jgi:hypothetical protein
MAKPGVGLDTTILKKFLADGRAHFTQQRGALERFLDAALPALWLLAAAVAAFVFFWLRFE